METDEALDPMAIRSLRSQAVMLQPQDIARLVEELLGLLAATARGRDATVNDVAFSDRPR